MYKLAILSALVAVCAAQIPQFTPEVAEATAAHLAAIAEAKARSTGAPVFNPHTPVAPTQVFNPTGYNPTGYNPAPGLPWKAWDGVPAPIVVAHGHVQDVAEVAAEKTRHFTLVADAAVRSASTGPHDDGKYRHDPSGDYVPYSYTPVHTPAVHTPDVHTPVVPGVHSPYRYSHTPVVVDPNGFIQDTPEVAALKAARLSELRSAGGTV